MNIKDQLADVLDEMRRIIDLTKSEKRDLTPDEEKRLEELNVKAGDLNERVKRAEKSAALLASIGGSVVSEPSQYFSGVYGGVLEDGQKGHMLLAGAQGKITAKSIAEQIRRKRGTKAFIESGAITSIVPLLPQGPIEFGKVPTSVLDVLKATAHDGPTWRYMRQTVRTNNAAIVAPGGTKPTSVVTIDDVDGALAVFAHTSEMVDKYLLADNDTLASFLAAQLLYMLQTKIEDEVLNGAGTTGHLTGILHTSGLQTQTFTVDQITTLRMAALKLENAGYTPDVFIVNSTDWATIETTRAALGTFDLGGPIDRAAQKAWGTQVVTSTRIAAGTALALDLDALGLDTDTRGIEVEWDAITGFGTNQVRARVEGRFGVSVFAPSGIVNIDIEIPEPDED